MTDAIEKSIDINASIDRVWRALTDHVEFGQWFGVALDGPFRPGTPARGRITHPGCECLTFTATVKTMTAPSLFSLTWHPYAVDPDKDYSHEPQTLIEFRLEPIAGGTRITVVESGFDALPADRRDEAFRMNEGGWEAQVNNIKAHVER